MRERVSTGLSCISLEKLDELWLHLHGGRQDARYLHEQPLDARALHLLQASLIAVQGASHYPHLLAYHVGGDFLRGVIARILGGPHGMDETAHVRLPHGHGDFVAAPHIAVLQGVRPLHYRVEGGVGVVREKQVPHERHLLAHPLAIPRQDLPGHGREDLYPHALKQPVRGLLGVAPFQVAHDKPLPGLNLVHRSGRGVPSNPAGYRKSHNNKQL